MGLLLIRCTRIWPITILLQSLKNQRCQADQIQQHFLKRREPSFSKRDRRCFNSSLNENGRCSFCFCVFTDCYFEIKVLAEQQAGKKAAAAAAAAATTTGSENERDRSPIRGNRTPLLPDPVPGSFAQIRPKRRALLPTPPGGQEESSAATNTPEGSDPVARYMCNIFILEDSILCVTYAHDSTFSTAKNCSVGFDTRGKKMLGGRLTVWFLARSYSEYYQQMHQYQQYQQYQQQYQYLQYAYTNPPPPPPPPATTQAQASTSIPPPPGTYSAPPTYSTSETYPPGTYDTSGSYDASSASYGASSGSYDASSGSYDASGGYGAAGAYDSSGAYTAAGSYSTSTPYEQTAAHGQPMPQRNDYPYHTPEPPYR